MTTLEEALNGLYAEDAAPRQDASARARALRSWGGFVSSPALDAELARHRGDPEAFPMTAELAIYAELKAAAEAKESE